MLRKLVINGVLAGLAAGLVAAVLHIALAVPIILEAELYESGAMVHFGDAAAVGSEAGESGSLLSRNLLTIVSMVATFSGYGLLLVAGFALAERRGHPIDGRTGILWGIGGFIAVQVAPAIGLPPELPGAAAADLVIRQVWWTGTVLFTALGIWVIAFARQWVPWVLGVILIAAPQIIGAPHPEVLQGVVPPELAALFVGRSIGTGLVAWLCLGVAAGYLWKRDTAAVQTA